MSIQRFQMASIFLSIALTMAGSRNASAHSDVFLTNLGGQVTVGGANDLAEAVPFFDLTTRVFAGVMISGFPPLGSNDYGRGEPGLFALSAGSADFPGGATALVGNAEVILNLPSFVVGGNTDSIFYWNGSGAVDFQPISTTQPGVALSFNPSPIDSTAADGFLHVHPAFELDNGGAGVPADGVYLVAPTASVVGMTDSNPFYMVWLVDQLLVDDDTAEELEESLELGQFVVNDKDFEFFEVAIEYVRVNVANVPEPSSAWLGAMAVLGLLGGRSRRRSQGLL